MKMIIPAITRPLKLSEYDPAFGEQTIQVWVNQPLDRLGKFVTLAREQDQARESLITPGADTQAVKAAVESLERIGAKLMSWLSEVWSQGPEDTRWTVAEIQELVAACLDRDSGLYRWLVRETWNIVTSHRLLQKKN